jgi:hypothetical protein
MVARETWQGAEVGEGQSGQPALVSWNCVALCLSFSPVARLYDVVARQHGLSLMLLFVFTGSP